MIHDIINVPWSTWPGHGEKSSNVHDQNPFWIFMKAKGNIKPAQVLCYCNFINKIVCIIIHVQMERPNALDNSPVRWSAEVADLWGMIQLHEHEPFPNIELWELLSPFHSDQVGTPVQTLRPEIILVGVAV